MAKNEYLHGTDEEKINSQYEKLIRDNSKSFDSTDDNTKQKSVSISNPSSNNGPMKSNLMTWTKMLEFMDEISDSIEAHQDNTMEQNIDDVPAVNNVVNNETNDEELLSQLNKIFTPVLIMQGFENDVSDKIQDAMSEAAVFTEKNVIQFDDQTRMAQLISVCALLIARQKNTEKYQMYAKAHKVRNQMKLDIQKEEYDAAKDLAQKYLVKVSQTNSSSVARNAANELLPLTT